MHLFKATEWQIGQEWYVNDVSDVLNSNAHKWWTQMRILQLTPEEYIKALKYDFNAKDCHYSEEHNVLVVCFKSQQDARKYKNYLNKKARELNYVI